MDITAGTGWVQMAVDFLSSTFNVMQGTAIAILVALKSAADALLRAKTDRSLDVK
jgi:hypothetical protein